MRATSKNGEVVIRFDAAELRAIEKAATACRDAAIAERDKARLEALEKTADELSRIKVRYSDTV